MLAPVFMQHTIYKINYHINCEQERGYPAFLIPIRLSFKASHSVL